MKQQSTSTDVLVADRAAVSWSNALMPVLPVIAIVFSAAIFFVDTYVSFDVAIAVLYVAVVLLSTSFCNRRGVFAVAVACVGLTILSFVIQHPLDNTGESAGRLCVALLAIGITTFLVDRIQSAADALASQARLLDLSHDAIFVCDMNDTVSYWNRGAERLYGWPRHAAIGKSARTLTQTAFPDAFEEINAQLLRKGYWEGELVDTRRDGSKVTVHSRWALLRDARGEPSTILETNTDIEATKQAEETLAQAQAELAHVTRLSTLGELTASIAHEVNQPLAAIVTSGEACLRWLERDEPQLDGVKRGVERMIGDGRRASEVVKRLRALAKKSDLRRLPINIAEIVDDALLLVQREIGINRIQLKRDYAADLPLVLGDRIQLQQVIINLVLNAIQAMVAFPGSLRELRIEMRSCTDDKVLVAVRDSGPGIDPQSENQLFNAFFTTKKEGMGMGLSICRSIIESHGGRVWASRNDTGGATFQFTVPRFEEEPI
jgi:two-component system, LuxR family, sensor kinase FixL